MSDENVNQGGDNSADQNDPIKQIKSEFGRKQDNVLNELNALKAQLGQITDTVISVAQTKRQEAAQSGEEFPDPVIDPKGYKEAIKRELRQEVNVSLSAERERTSTLSSLVSQYPELQDSNSELTQQALRIYNGLSAAEKQSAASYKLAVMQAAQEVGVLPVNKRQSKNNSQDSEDFTINSSSNSTRRPSQNRKEEKIDERTLEFARLLGRPVDDPKYMDNLKKTITTRKRSWSKFE